MPQPSVSEAWTTRLLPFKGPFLENVSNGVFSALHHHNKFS